MLLSGIIVVGCAPSETCAPSIEVEVHVYDVMDSVVEGATVELSEVPCDVLGAGDYLCTTTEAGRHRLFVYDPRWRAHAEFLDLVEPAGCTAEVVAVEVLLVQGMGL